MRSESGKRRIAARWFEIESPIAERMELETSPRMSTVASYVFTGAAERAWEVLNQHLEGPQGGVFWIGGPPGSGKTHFLNYVIALQKQAGALDTQNARRLVCGLELAGRIDSAEIELILLSVLAEQMGVDRREGDIFRQIRGAAALNVGLENARRMGIRAVTVAIDFGMSDSAAAADLFAMLAEVAASFRQVKFTVIAAGRSGAPVAARVFEVAPRDANEETTIALRRARRLVEDADNVAAEMYAQIDTGALAPNTIFPFHPAALRALRGIAEHSNRTAIVALSRLAREALSSSPFDGEVPPRLIYPPDLTMNAAVSDQIKARLPESARAAWKIARDAVAGLDAYDRDLARELVDTLMLEHCSGGKLSLEELKSQVPAIARGDDARPTHALRELIQLVETSAGGAIRLENDWVRFDPDAAGAPELAQFSGALAIARRFDPQLTIARDRNGLDERLRQLDLAMAHCVEAAVRTREVLASTLKEANLRLPAADSAAIAKYIELAEAGAHAMLEAAADRSNLAAMAQIIDAYEALAAAAAAIPQMRSMREYLAATGLRALHEDRASGEPRESAVTALETECELLQVELGPRILTGPPRSLDALEARFQKFKWTYVQCYLSAHARWRDKMERLDVAVGDTRRYFEALTRLNRITALGAPEGAHLGTRLAELGARVVRCELGDAIAPETTPRCPSCGFQLGAATPQAELDDAMEAIRRALEIKLAALSQSMISRLIREHDREHRLEGFLKNHASGADRRAGARAG